MSAIDDEVVRMRFDNSAFARGVTSTIGMLSKLKSSLSFSGADKGLDNIENKANKLDMSGMNKQIDESARHWSAWRTAGLIAFATVVHRAVNAAINIGKAFTTGPIKAGFDNYETQINAVQTILANTGLKGSKGLGQVNKALGDLNTYANQTVYNFSEMAKNIGTFTAAGVKLKPATNAIKGIANLAALSGSNSQQASTAMYQLSQAIAANKVGLQDWNSVVNAGMGGKVFQNALFNAGKLQHTLKGVKANETFDQWTKAGNSFRQSLQTGWITGKVLTDTLSQFTGDLTDAQLKAQGYNKTQIKQIQELAKTASGAATHIKTLSQLQDALKEEVATAYGAIFKTIFGDINGATKLFSGIHTVVENALTVPIYALNTLLEQTVKLGGRTRAIDAFKNVFKALGAVLKPIKQAYRDIFPATTAKQLAGYIKSFDDFTKRLTISGSTADKIKRTFQGFFAIFDIAKQVVSGVAHVFIELFSTFSGGAASGFLGITANIGDMIVAFDKALKAGGALNTFFSHMGHILAVPLAAITSFGHILGQMFSGFKASDAHGVTNLLDTINDKLAVVDKAGQHIQNFFSGLPAKLKPGIQAVVHAFSGLGDAIARGLNSQAFSNILKTIQVGLLGAMALMFKKFFKSGLGGVNLDIGGGAIGKIGEAFEALTNKTKAMTQNVKADSLQKIAIAIALLTASVVAISFVDPKRLGTALQAMAVGFGELLGAFKVLTSIGGVKGFLKVPVMAASLNLLATAILILSAAVKVLASMSWDELKQGLTAVGILLGELVGTALIISKNSASMLAAGIGINAMAVAITILAGAVKLFSMMQWSDMLKGLAGVGGALAAVAIGMRAMPARTMVLQAAALVLIAGAINALYLAVKSFSSLNWTTMAKGLGGVVGTLVGIAAAMRLMPKGMIAQAAGLVIISGALLVLEKAVSSMGNLSFGVMIKGIAGIAGVLLVLAGAMNVMDASLPGAAALAVVAGALTLLMPVVERLGKQSWGEIGKGLLTLAGALAILVVGATAAEAVIPGLVALGVAAVALGAGIALAGVGIAALGTGLSLLAATGSAGIAVLIGAISALIKEVPAIAVAFAQGLVSILEVIGKNGPAIVAAFSTIIGSILTAIITNAPKLAQAFEVLIQQALGVITKEAPAIIAAGLAILMDLLTGIQNNIGRIVHTVGNIIVNFLNAVANELPRIIKAGVNLLTKFLIGVATAMGKIPSIAVRVIIAFVTSLMGNFGKIVSTGIAMLGKLVHGISSAMGSVISKAGDVIVKFIKGLANGAGSLVAAGVALLGHLIKGIGEAIKNAALKVYHMALDLGKKIVSGVVDGIKGLVSSLTDKLKSSISGVLGGAVGWIHHLGGPACAIGQPIVAEIAKGIGDNTHLITKSLQDSVGDALQQSSKTLTNMSIPSIDNLNPTITPVLDLSQVQKDAGKISGMIAANPITATVSTTSATSISAAQQAAAADAASTETTPAPQSVEIKFEQTNTSPKALSTVEIYRQTTNLISQAKAALKVPTPSVTV